MTDPAARISPLQQRIFRLRRRLAWERTFFLTAIVILTVLLVRERRIPDAFLLTVGDRQVAILGSEAELQEAIGLAKRRAAPGWPAEDITFAPELKVSRTTHEGQPFLDPRKAAAAISRYVQMVGPCYAITVNGKSVASLRTKDDADRALGGAGRHYPYAGRRPRFVEKVKVIHSRAPITTLLSVDQAIQRLTRPVHQPIWYTVQFGDTAEAIAKRHGLTLAALRRLNQRLAGGALPAGGRLLVGLKTSPPPLTVITVREDVVYAPIDSDEERMTTSSLPPGVRKVVSRGRPGKGMYLQRITYHNGRQQRKELILQDVVQPPTPTRVLVGG